MASLNSLMSGGYEPDNETDIMSDFELYIEKIEGLAFEMTLEQLYTARFNAMMDGDDELAKIYDKEIDSRNPAISVPACPTLADEPCYCDDPDHEDRRKDWLENYAADQFEQNELPF